MCVHLQFKKVQIRFTFRQNNACECLLKISTISQELSKSSWGQILTYEFKIPQCISKMFTYLKGLEVKSLLNSSFKNVPFHEKRILKLLSHSSLFES